MSDSSPLSRSPGARSAAAVRVVQVLGLVGMGAFALASSGCHKRKKIDDETLSLAVGARHACALMTDKGVRCWGANELGQLGVPPGPPHPRPVRMIGTTQGFVDLAAGGALTCARTEQHTVECWGGMRRHTASGFEPIPIDVRSLKDVEQLAIGENHACARMEMGTVRCFGDNEYGQLGAGAGGPARDRVAGLVEVGGLWGVVWISAGKDHTCAVVTDGSVRCWGRNQEGQLGDGTTKDSAAIVTVASLTGVQRVACGAAHTCALLRDGSVRCWGKNDQGQLGDGTQVHHLVPTAAVSGLEEQKGLAAGDANTCAWGADGAIRCWGANDHSQMADGTHEPRPTPHRIPGFSGPGFTPVPELTVAIATLQFGDGFACVRASDKRIRCWGQNDAGQAGDGTREVRTVPVAVELAKPTG
jgi:alpha-tubulin suppressor-like RCC1 family protein